MTRFEQELRGDLGAFWKKDAEQRIANMSKDVANGFVTIDENGVARNRVGRVLMEDQIEVLSLTGCKFSEEATNKAREEETAKVIAKYNRTASNASREEMHEIRGTFGAGTTVVDVISGKKIKL